MVKITTKNLNSGPDEMRKFEKGKVYIATFSDVTIGRAEFEPWLEMRNAWQLISQV